MKNILIGLVIMMFVFSGCNTGKAVDSFDLPKEKTDDKDIKAQPDTFDLPPDNTALSIYEQMELIKQESPPAKLGYDLEEWYLPAVLEEDEQGEFLLIGQGVNIHYTHQCEGSCEDSEIIIELEEDGITRELECTPLASTGSTLECILDLDENTLPVQGTILFSVNSNPSGEKVKSLKGTLRYRQNIDEVRKKLRELSKTGNCKCLNMVVHDLGTNKANGGLMHDFIVEADLEGSPPMCKPGQEISSTIVIRTEEGEEKELDLKEGESHDYTYDTDGTHGVDDNNPVKDDYTNENVGEATSDGVQQTPGQSPKLKFKMMVSKDGDLVWEDNPGYGDRLALYDANSNNNVIKHKFKFHMWVKDSDGNQNPECEETIFIEEDLEHETSSLIMVD